MTTFILEKLDFKQRLRKHKSDVEHSQNSICREFAEQLRDCTKIEPPFFSDSPV